MCSEKRPAPARGPSFGWKKSTIADEPSRAVALPSERSPIISVAGLTRTYGDLTAVDAITFAVGRGSLFAFLGPNGAGKSTTISMVTTLLAPSSGTVTYFADTEVPLVAGRDDPLIRRAIGVVFQDSLLDRELTVEDNLLLRASFYHSPRSRVDEIAETLEMGELLRHPYGHLSGGQRRRSDIARALLNRPKVLFLDEPTTGLDPQSRHLVWETIEHLQRRLGITVFLTTHSMEEVERADEVRMIDHGRLIAHGTPDSLRATYAHHHLRVPARAGLSRQLADAGFECTEKDGVIDAAVSRAADAIAFLERNTSRIDDFEFIHGTMDDVFLALTGEALRED